MVCSIFSLQEGEQSISFVILLSKKQSFCVVLYFVCHLENEIRVIGLSGVLSLY